jgi:hypothetical protein
MARKFRYQNCNPFPVFVPGKTGGQVMFNPGQFSTSEWFGAFVGPKRLTRLPLEAPIERDGIQGPPPNPRIRRDLPAPKEEETEYFVRSRGIYACKLCGGDFRTGAYAAFEIHLKEAHKKNLKAKPKPTPPPPPPPKPKEPVDSVVPGGQPAPKPEPKPTPPPKPEEEEGVPCPVCGRRFKSQRGVKSHMGRMHKPDRE